MTQPVALVTGCSSGFGLAIAQALRGRGFRVLAGVRDLARVPAALADCEVTGLDVGDERSIAAAASSIDRLDCLVNNAGYALTGPFASYDARQLRTQLEVNVVGPALLVQALLPALTRAGGRIINVGSMAGEVALPLNAAYCASKAALHAMSDALRHELAEHGVQVAAVVPGGHRTRFMANMVWGAHDVRAGSIEARQYQAYRAFQARLAARPGRSPEAVARAVARLAQCEVMPARVYVGSDARITHALLRVLPARWSEALVSRALRRRLQATQP